MSQQSLALAEPVITGYQHRAIPLSILGLHATCLPWIFEHFIQVYCHMRIDDAHNVFDFADPNMLVFPTPYLAIQHIERSLLTDFISDFKQFVIDCLQHGYYIYLYVDEYFIPDRTPFQKEHIAHDILFSGFNDITAEFTVAGFNEQGLYKPSIITYQQFQQATTTEQLTPQACNPVLLLQVNNDVSHEFSLFHVTALLTDYYNSTVPSQIYAMFQPSFSVVYGLQTYEALSYYVRCGQKQQVELETRPFQILLEHKQLMLQRLYYLHSYGYLHSLDEFTQSYTELKQMALAIRNGLIKYQLTGQEQRLEKMIDQLSMMHIQERTIIKKILEEIH